jgi:RNA polymerase-binding transcription factor DksA
VNERPEQTAEASPNRAVPDAPDRSPNADLDRIGRDLAGVEAALARLDDGTYWTDEVTGEQIPDAVLISDPVARRAV